MLRNGVSKPRLKEIVALTCAWPWRSLVFKSFRFLFTKLFVLNRNWKWTLFRFETIVLWRKINMGTELFKVRHMLWPCFFTHRPSPYLKLTLLNMCDLPHEQLVLSYRWASWRSRLHEKNIERFEGDCELYFKSINEKRKMSTYNYEPKFNAHI